MALDIAADERTFGHDFQSLRAHRFERAVRELRADPAALERRRNLGMGEGDDAGRKRVIGGDPTKGKQLTNMRASGSDDKVYLAATYKLDIEKAMEIVAPDEYIEITPKSVRLRKKNK